MKEALDTICDHVLQGQSLFLPWKQSAGLSLMSFPTLLTTHRAEGSSQDTSTVHRCLLTDMGRGLLLRRRSQWEP